MARPLYKPKVKYDYYDNQARYASNIRPASVPFRVKRVKKHKSNPFVTLFQLFFATIAIIYIVPHYMDNITRPLFHSEKYPAVNTDYNFVYSPTSKYLTNSTFLGKTSLKGVEVKQPKMQKLYETYSMPLLEAKLINLAKTYPSLSPSVYVWDYESGKFANLRADEVYPTASIIKLPVLIELFKSIEAGKITLNERIAMTEYYKSEGSGSLQFKGLNNSYTVDELARVMITESDNSATNMLLSAIGGMNGLNNALRQWGMKETRINDWLPDLAGTNVSTAHEMAAMLYNLDNPAFLTLNSREKIVDYMSHVHNNRLIQAGLPADVPFIHKTGDIGKMLGDAGIVYTPNGKKYIVVMFVNRPYNSPLGKDFIVKASSLIYKHMISI